MGPKGELPQISIHLYWTIGRDLVQRQEQQGWGAKIIDKLAADLATAFPAVEGFSRTNIYRMRAFYQAWPGFVGRASIVPQPVGQLAGSIPANIAAIPWGHNLILIEKLKTAEERLWYARKTIEHGWSRAVLVHQIETDLHGRQGRAVTNFSRTFPSPDSDLVHQLLKDPYNFDFLTLADDADERALERSLIERIRDFLLELAHKGAARELTETVGAGTIFVVR